MLEILLLDGSITTSVVINASTHYTSYINRSISLADLRLYERFPKLSRSFWVEGSGVNADVVRYSHNH
jgi:hypothetical protein